MNRSCSQFMPGSALPDCALNLPRDRSTSPSDGSLLINAIYSSSNIDGSNVPDNDNRIWALDIIMTPIDWE